MGRTTVLCTISVAMAAGLAAALLVGCAPTTYDASRATVEVVPTSTTIPTGTTPELLQRLTTESSALSGVMIAAGDASAAVRSIDAVWDVVRDDVQQQRPDLIEEFDANVAKLRDAVQFRRAADADKAAKNIDALVSALAS